VHWVKIQIDRIQGLISQGGIEHITYAALECRLALERVCYERLSLAHEYISSDDIGRWQPRDVVNKLIAEVDPHVASSCTVSVSRRVRRIEGDEQSGDEDEEEYVEIRKQAGFDAKKLGKIWNALGNFLHVPLPKTKTDIQTFGNAENIKAKIAEAIALLEEVRKGNLLWSGVGELVRFECYCGAKNKRRAEPLREGQVVSCINPDCPESWTVCLNGDAVGFQPRVARITCTACELVTEYPEGVLLSLKRENALRFCCGCGEETFLAWRLVKVDKP
jgi:hypothetical protein